MPAPRKRSLSHAYSELTPARIALGESRDCTVVAISIVTGKTYEEAHAAMKAAGRKDGGSGYYHQEVAALKALGFQLKRVEVKDIIATYPAPHCRALKNVTTYHAHRFPEAWAPYREKRLLLWVSGHVAAMKDGVVHDWSSNRALRVYKIAEVVPL